MARRNNLSYGLSQPVINVFPEPIKAKRAPTVNDKTEIGSLWIDMVHRQAYTLTAIANNQAIWSTNTTLGVGVFNAVEATVGNITCDAGDIIATLGSISAGAAVIAGNTLTVAAGDLTVSTGDVVVNVGNVIITAGNLRVTAGDIDTIAGNINSSGSISAATTISAAGNITTTLGNVITGAGNVDCGGFITSIGNIVSTVGTIRADTGNIIATAGNITATAGDVAAGGALSCTGNLTVGGDIALTGNMTSGAILATDINATSLALADLGSVKFFGNAFMHTGNFPLGWNTYLGLFSGTPILAQGGYNVGLGGYALGSVALNNIGNVAAGYTALRNMTTGSFNVAVGKGSLYELLTGDNNTCVGQGSFANVTTASYNIGIGFEAGINCAGFDSSNIYIGNKGFLGESNTIRIGTDGAAPGQQDACYLAGVVTTARDVIVSTGNVTVMNGDLQAIGAGKGVVLGGGATVVCGNGDPSGSVTAPKGSLYLRLDGSAANNRAYINTDGATAWTNITTAA